MTLFLIVCSVVVSTLVGYYIGKRQRDIEYGEWLTTLEAQAGSMYRQAERPMGFNMKRE